MTGRRSRLGVVSLIIALGAAGLAGWAVMAVEHADTAAKLEDTVQDKRVLAEGADTTAERVLALCGRGDRFAAALHRAGLCGDSRQLQELVEGPAGAMGLPGPAGPGPTDDQIRAAVMAYCTEQPGGSCEGSGPTAVEVHAAVVAYCADGRCRGKPGQAGVPGQPGIRGEPGSDPTDEQIRSAVLNYCLQQPGGSCEGAPGQNGTDGTDGTDGTNGTDGTDGRDGQPPAGWTWTDPGPPERTYTCTRNPDSPDDHPTYTCRTEES